MIWGGNLKNYDKLTLILKDFEVLKDLKTLKVAEQSIWVTGTKSISFDLFIL